MIYIGPDWFIIAIMTVAKTENSIILKIGNIVIQQFSYLPPFTKRLLNENFRNQIFCFDKELKIN